MTSTQALPGQDPSAMDSLFVQVLQALADNAPNTTAGRDWLPSVAQDIANLPWPATHLPDDRRPLEPAPAAELLIVLLRHLRHDALPPTSVNPTGDGGVTAQWHLPGYDLEIFCEPSQPPDYLVRTAHLEYEGPITGPDLAAHLALMPPAGTT